MSCCDITVKQADFLLSEFNTSMGDIKRMSDDDLDGLYAKIAEIEIEESVKCQETVMSERGNIAVSLVDYLYNYPN